MVEGEKCVKYLQPFLDEWVVVTWMGGEGRAKSRDFSALDGRDVTWWPDADVPKPDKDLGVGERAMREAMEAASPARSRWLQPLETWRECQERLRLRGPPRTRGHSVRQERPEGAAHRDPESPEPSPEAATSRHRTHDWLPEGKELVLTKKGEPVAKSPANLWLFIRYHPVLRGRYKFDEFDQCVEVAGVEMTEAMLRDELVLLSGDHFRLDVTSDRLASEIWAIAQECKYNPMADRLRALAERWDGKSRYLLDYAGVDTTEWSQLVSRRWGIGLAKRMLEPGCPHDGVLILEGAQGVGKTTFLRDLGNSLGRNLLVTVHDLHFKDNKAMKLQGKAIADMSEMTALAKSENGSFKAMIGETHDNYRIPWGKRNHDFARTVVFAGTTNPTQEGYLTDPTGNRRIWPVKVERWGDREAFKRDSDQIWGELARRALDGEENEMTGHEAAFQRGEAEQREAIDPWQYILEPFLALHSEVPYATIWGPECLQVQPERRNPSTGRRVGEIMHKLGWEKFQKRSDNGARYWMWRRA